MPKSETLARTILNAKLTNEQFLRPWQINLCEPTRVPKEIARELGARRRKLMKSGGDGKIWMVALDWRHYFHQIAGNGFLQSFFALCWQKETGGTEVARWLNVPRGWSWAPYIAQCLGWHFITHRDTMFNIDSKMTTPPQYLRTTDGDGLASLDIDNVHGYFLSKTEAEEFLKQVERNMQRYNV